MLERDTSAGTSPLQAGAICPLWDDKVARAIKMSVGHWHLGIGSIYLAQQYSLYNFYAKDEIKLSLIRAPS